MGGWVGQWVGEKNAVCMSCWTLWEEKEEERKRIEEEEDYL